MKAIIISVVVLATILALVFGDFAPEGTVTPEIKRTGNYEHPIKDGNCYIQKDSAGNHVKVCG